MSTWYTMYTIGIQFMKFGHEVHRCGLLIQMWRGLRASVFVCVCWSQTRGCVKTAEPIEIPFRVWTRTNPTIHVGLLNGKEHLGGKVIWQVWYGMVNVDLYSAIITKVSNGLNTLVSGEKPGFQDVWFCQQADDRDVPCQSFACLPWN